MAVANAAADRPSEPAAEVPRWRRRTEQYDPPLTVEQFLALPEPEGWHGKRELVDGQVVEMAPTGVSHMLVCRAIARAWEDAAGPVTRPDSRGLVTDEVLSRLAPDEATLRAPDVAFLSRERYPGPYRAWGRASGRAGRRHRRSLTTPRPGRREWRTRGANQGGQGSQVTEKGRPCGQVSWGT